MHVLLKNSSVLCLYFLTLLLVGIWALSLHQKGWWRCWDAGYRLGARYPSKNKVCKITGSHGDWMQYDYSWVNFYQAFNPRHKSYLQCDKLWNKELRSPCTYSIEDSMNTQPGRQQRTCWKVSLREKRYTIHPSKVRVYRLSLIPYYFVPTSEDCRKLPQISHNRNQRIPYDV
jgi:hypothetical protein